MAESPNLSAQLEAARQQHAAARAALLQMQTRVRQLNATLAQLERFGDAHNQAQLLRRQQVMQTLREAKAAVDRQKSVVAAAKAREDSLFDQWIAALPPQRRIGQLNDAFPILLLPVRLETRFKVNPPRPPLSPYELWVRVFPDDCAVDTFESALTAGELQDVQAYWRELWRAGGIEDLERSAWRNLVASHGAGRALWLVQQVRPVDVAPKPQKTSANDMVLVIPTETALAPNEQSAVAGYWTAIWRAAGEQPTAAWQALVTALGIERAKLISEKYRPFNLADTPPAALSRSQVAVTVAQLVLPPAASIATKATTWTQSPKVHVLPERFVLVGYSGNQLVIEQVGAPIPSPLVAGLDPSAAPEDQLQQKEGELIVSEEMRWMVDFPAAIKKGMGFKVPL